MGKGESSAPALHTVGSRVWLADSEDGWVKGEVVRIEDNTSLTVKLENGSEKVCDQNEIPLQNPGVRGVEDMTTLSYLNEPGVLWNLKVRYEQDDIYTYTGSILIAVNPFTSMPHLYGSHMMEQYRGTQLGELSPHVYAIADTSYRQMRRNKKSQSILVSGESGAGKTETSKLLMQYLAWMGGYLDNSPVQNSGRTVEQQVLESNPLLEAFGNAKTVRNDNSSRFGKFTEIQFNESGRISGAAIRTYLLERSRVVNVNDPERNYHIFYQLCDGATEEERKALHLRPASEFQYLNRSSCYDLKGMSNAEEYSRTRRAMSLVGISPEDQDSVFRVVAAVLHLGNIVFEDDGDESARTKSGGDADRALAAAADVLGVDAEGLRRILTTRTRQTPDGPIVSPIDVKAADDNRDSLAKTLYSRMFDWLVDCINTSIGQDPNATSIIGVLDIYGFEQFAQNDFEQFCINLANEKLQQHFNQHVFKMEQAEYEKEGIEWSYIEFVDNQDVLDLIEGKMGVLDLLDESCRFPKATHEDYAQKLYSTSSIADSSRFSKPRLAKSDFTIDHYAGGVTYRTENFLIKNKDFVVAEHQSLLTGSAYGFVKVLFSEKDVAGDAAAATSASGPKSSYKFSSVGSQFKRQLADLMVALHSMEPHYIRCIKPNSLNMPMEFENSNVLHQLRCGGVLEAVRISCAGYPTKPRYEEFVDHFWPLAVDSFNEGEDDKALTQRIVRSVLGANNESSQFGTTRVFLRAGRMAELDKRRAEVLNNAAGVIQRYAKTWLARLQFQRTRAAVITLQSAVRTLLARREAQRLRENRAATTLQSAYRTHLARSYFKSAVRAAICIQDGYRAHKAREAAIAAETVGAAIAIQSCWRRHMAQSEFSRIRRGVIAAQTAWRCKLAKRELVKRRIEARESTKLLQDKQTLETKLQDVQNVLETLQNQRNELRQALRDEKIAREEAEGRVASAEAAAAAQQRASLSAAAAELAATVVERDALSVEVASLKEAAVLAAERAAAETSALRTESEELKSRVESLERQCKEIENSARVQVEDLMNRLNNAVTQRNEAREEALMNGAKLKQLQDEIASGKMVAATTASSTPGNGHLVVASTPTSAALSDRLHHHQKTMYASSPGRENAAPMHIMGGRAFIDGGAGGGGDALTEMDRRQRELYAKQQQLLREQRSADQERLLTALKTDLGFSNGHPIAATLIFRCCLQWKALQADRTPIFDRINLTMGEEVEHLQEDNNRLAYWLSNTVALYYLMQKHIKPASGGGGYAARIRQSGQQAARGLLGSAGKSISAYFGRAATPGSPSPEEASIHGGTAISRGPMRQVEAKYPALLFKQQLDAFVQKIFQMLRDNVKKEISPCLIACIHAPRSTHGGRPTSRKASGNGQQLDAPSTPTSAAGTGGDASIVASWKQILSVFDALLVTLKANSVPPFLARKLFEQLFSFVNVQLFNHLLLRRECCSFSNGEYVKTGLSEVELWTGRAGREWLGDSWDNLGHIRQAVTFLVIHQKGKKTLQEIMQDLCPVLSVQQLYRISTMYWDDRYGTETVSHDVLARMKQMMVEGAGSSAAGHSFLLDDDSTIPFSQEDIAGVLDGNDLFAEVPVPEQLKDAPSFSFLGKRLDVELQAAPPSLA